MSSTARRDRGLTTASANIPLPLSAFTSTLTDLLKIVRDTLDNPSNNRTEDLQAINERFKDIRKCLNQTPRHEKSKDAFRHLEGFPIIIQGIRAASGFYDARRTQHDKEILFELLSNSLGLLQETLRGHHGNRRFFRKRVEGGGWQALQETIASIGLGGSDFDPWSERQLFGILLAFALDDETVSPIYHDLQGALDEGTASGDAQWNSAQDTNGATAMKSTARGPPTHTPERTSKHARAVMRHIIQQKLQDKTLHNHEVVPVILGFWDALPRANEGPPSYTSLSTLLIFTLAANSQTNLKLLHSASVLSSMLRFVFGDSTEGQTVEQDVAETLAESLMSLGLTSLEDARYLLRSRRAQAAEFLLRMMKQHHPPPHVQFDLSAQGFAAIELPNLCRQFPPPQSVPGYSFTAWVKVETFDPKSHTTIFGVYDSSQTCFLLAYIERDTHNFILQTSVTASKPSVRFKSHSFKPNRWYHIALVHRKSRVLTASKASLYVDGEFVEQMKINFPAPAPSSKLTTSMNASTESFASFTSFTSKVAPIQAFVGTPQELSSGLGHNLVHSKWSLASAHLFEDVLSDDLVAVHYRLGPRYTGNFQDCLGSFQTYEASACLDMRNHTLHPGKEETSEILAAIRDKAGNLLPEHRILLSFLPHAIISDSAQDDENAPQLLNHLSKNAQANLHKLATKRGTDIALNSAVSFYNDALTRPNGTASLHGGTTVVVPQNLDDAMWRLGGCTALGLKLVESAKSKAEIVRAVEIFCQSISSSWRNSEAMERENGYALLATLLRTKLGSSSALDIAQTPIEENARLSHEDQDQLSFQLLSIILEFVGYNHRKPEESMIVNPMGYRILLADYDMWRKGPMLTQKLYYSQFITFGVNSKYHVFNSRRLNRMRIVKRLLDAMKGESVPAEVFPSLLEAFKVLLKISNGPEILRSVSLFITYSFHRPASTPGSKTPRSRHGTVGNDASSLSSLRRPTVSSLAEPPADGILSKRELGVGVMRVYTELLCELGSLTYLSKFAKTVTNKWLLHLLVEDNPEVVVLATKILARLLTTQGTAYVKKFGDATGGFVVLSHRLKKWWDVPPLYPVLFSILFNLDVAQINFEQSFDLSTLSSIFRDRRVVYPEVLPVVVGMLEEGLRSLVKSQDDPDSPHAQSRTPSETHLNVRPAQTRRRSMSLTKELEARQLARSSTETIGGQGTVLRAVAGFLSHLHRSSPHFRDFAVSSEYVRQVLAIIFPAVVSTDPVSPEVELNSRDSALTHGGEDVVIRPISQNARAESFPAIRTVPVESARPASSHNPRSKPLRRGSSFILVSHRKSPDHLAASPVKFAGLKKPQRDIVAQQTRSAVVEELLELVVQVFIDQILIRKEFPGFGLFLKVPPGFQEHQAFFQTYILRNTISQLTSTLQIHQSHLREPRVINNLTRLCNHLNEAVFEGWFIGGAEPVLDFAGFLLEYFQRPDIAKLKYVRLCIPAIRNIRDVFLKVILLRLSEIDDEDVDEQEAAAFMHKLFYWQTIFLWGQGGDNEFLKYISYQLYTKLVDKRRLVRTTAADLWRILLVQKPDETAAILSLSLDSRDLIRGFKNLMGLDNDSFLEWVDGHRAELDGPLFGSLSKPWEDLVNSENAKTTEMMKLRLLKRKERLRQWQAEIANANDIVFRMDVAANLWIKNIYAAEHVKHQKTLQDHRDTLSYNATAFAKMERDLLRSCAVFDTGIPTKWRLDPTEGRNRMRLRLIPDREVSDEYRPKKTGDKQLSVNINSAVVDKGIESPKVAATPPVETPRGLDGSGDTTAGASSIFDAKPDDRSSASVASPDEDFEFVENDDPNDGDDDNFEDKQRKVMRALNSKDVVLHVFNISRIVGLEGCEGLLIMGKESLYIMDDYFQRSDGEIVDVWSAPANERDPYVQMITGKDVKQKPMHWSRSQQDTRSWKWSEVLSISKRRFLFRDAAVEIFFNDGRSYLLTALNPEIRNQMHAKLTQKSPALNDKTLPANAEDAWRLEALKTTDEANNSFGSRIVGLMNATTWNPSMKRWAKGEISNFHYLMLVNTMAGRTFNDLTQYPVFPWVIADYTSEELDLDNPATFRDLSKPMGCQNPQRERDFIERYKAFLDMGEEHPFHYGTHYTSAMIVASYLVRLQPFVQSYLLIQGGNFDHPDRMFYSIAKAWTSASRDNMTDVRELTPEFFYLPEFLTNSNKFNFGKRQGTGGSVDNVELPPWAKGDPKIFIAKNREALESPYVSRHLHEWIDLVFGCKQNGEAAIENVNVFHHMSYRGAADLDKIEDIDEKRRAISIIHNFGQTPHQVFARPHMPRDDAKSKPKRLDTSAASLTRLPFPLFEFGDAITSLIYSSKLDRLLCAGPLRAHMPPVYERYLEWGFADNSVRFYNADNRKLAGLFENLHVGQLSAVCFADSKMLVTAGEDCVLSVWNLSVSERSRLVDLSPRISLFGHKTAVSVIHVSKVFSTILSASTDGVVLMWDLNRLEFIRRLSSEAGQVECMAINNVTGDIMICRGQRVTLYTLNGEIILKQNVCDTGDSHSWITSCAFYEGNGCEWLENQLIFTGHKGGVAKVWRKVVIEGKWRLELVKRLEHKDDRQGAISDGGGAAITAVLPHAGGLYTADEDGKAYQWDVVQRAK